MFMLAGGLREGERGSLRTTRKIFWMLGIVAVIGWLYILLQSELFEVQAIEVQGAKMNDPLEVEREVYQLLDQDRGWTPWQSRHMWFVDTGGLAHHLQQSLYLEDVRVQKEGRHILRLTIKEYPHRLVIYQNQQFYWVDLRGELDGELSTDERQQILSRVYGKRLAQDNESPLIHLDKLDVSTSTHEIFTPERLKSFIGFTVDLQKFQLPYRELRVETVSSTKITLINGQGTPVYFDLGTSEGLQRQLQTYKAFTDSQRGIKGPPMYQYIDVRIPDMIYLR